MSASILAPQPRYYGTVEPLIYTTNENRLFLKNPFYKRYASVIPAVPLDYLKTNLHTPFELFDVIIK